MQIKRVVVWFSAGVTSAVAAKIALEKYAEYPVVVAYCDTGSEHPDNKRFISDVSSWLQTEIATLKSEKYLDIWDVFDKTKFLVGINSARCTLELKKRVRQDFENLSNDLQVFGFDNSEKKRANLFTKNNIEGTFSFPLIDSGITKAQSMQILKAAGIKIPAMYQLGYRNNNCIGCVKGAKGYWNKIRHDFPDVYLRMSKVERQLGVAINVMGSGSTFRHVYLDELPVSAGNYKQEPELSCSIWCDSGLS